MGLGHRFDFSEVFKIIDEDFARYGEDAVKAAKARFVAHFRKESRSAATYKRHSVIYHQSGKCWVCELWCRPIAQVHHIIPVENDGSGEYENLVALCPNCHATVHALKKAIKAPHKAKYGWEPSEKMLESMYQAAHIVKLRELAAAK
jgi:5-methylcytosine-specific restriction endonuclease McrA